jgi:hypothetical protein
MGLQCGHVVADPTRYSITRGTQLARIAFAIAMLGTMLGFGVLGTLIFGT